MLAPSKILAQTLLAEGAAAGSPFGGLLPFVLMIGVFYFLVLRPMSKQEKERKQRLAELKRGDRVVLTGGLLGRISRVDEDIAIVELADKVKVRVLKKDISDFEENALAQSKKDRGVKDDKKDAEDAKGKGKGKADKAKEDDSESRKAG